MSSLVQKMENNIYAEIIATIAGILSTMAFIPQAYKIFITNETNDLDIRTELRYKGRSVTSNIRATIHGLQETK